jgi:hypothetical protein
MIISHILSPTPKQILHFSFQDLIPNTIVKT